MKKTLISILLMLSLILTITACTDDKADADSSGQPASTETVSPTNPNGVSDIQKDDGNDPNASEPLDDAADDEAPFVQKYSGSGEGHKEA